MPRSGWRERRGVAARAPRHSGPARLAAEAKPNIAAIALACSALLRLRFPDFRFSPSFFNLLCRIVPRIHRIYRTSYRMRIYGRQMTVCGNPGKI